MGAPSLREQKKIETRDEIARAAIRLFLQRGFDAVSISQIAEAARVSKMTVSNYFPLKEDLFFFRAGDIFPDLAAAVRLRKHGQSVDDAVRAYVIAEFDRRAEWTGLSTEDEPYTEVIRASVTLSNAVHRHWLPARGSLTEALAVSYPTDLATILAAQLLAIVEALVAANRRFVSEDPSDALERGRALAERAFSMIRIEEPVLQGAERVRADAEP